MPTDLNNPLVLPLIMLLLALWISSGFTLYFWLNYRSFKGKMDNIKRRVEDTSRILIDKNLELNDQNVHQQKLLESREDFIAIVSHQLRTPATEIKWGIGEIRDGEGWKLTSSEREYMDRLYMSAEWMVNLIDRLVKLVNLDQGPGAMLFSPYAPDEAIRASAEQIALLFSDKKITFNLDLRFGGVLLSIDPDSLKMIISNLVENAFHYTPKGGAVEVTSSRREDGSLVFAVADNGAGIPEEKQKTMFIKFQRSADAVKVNTKGMGLGLYVVKKVIEQRRGTITFTTEVGKGTTFTVIIPAT